MNPKLMLVSIAFITMLGLCPVAMAATPCPFNAAAQGNVMTDNSLSKVEIIEAPQEVALHKIKKGHFIWESAPKEPEYTYAGTLALAGRVAIFVPKGKQLDTWVNFDHRVHFCVRNPLTGKTYKSSYVAGGWNLARQGVSVQMAEPPFIPEVYAQMPDNQVDERRFSIDLIDRLSDMPEPGDTIEVTAEYMGVTSNTVTIKLGAAPEEPDH